MKPLPKLSGDLSARDFILETGVEVQDWLDDQVLSGKVDKMQWHLIVTLADGRQIIVHRLSAHGQSLVKITGVLQDGVPCLFISHQNSIQLLAVFIPRAPKEEKQREMGFHTLIIGDKKIEPSA